MVEAGDAEPRQQQRKHHHEPDRETGADNGADREEERNQIEPNDAALFFFVVDDVERVEDRLHAGIGAPQRDGKSKQEAEREPAVALGRDAGDLGTHDVERIGGDDVGGDLEVIADGGRVGKQGIGRHSGGDTGKQGDQRIERDPGGKREQPVLLDLPIGADKNILPAGPWNLQRPACPPAAAVFGGAPFLPAQRLLGRRCARRHGRGTRLAGVVAQPETIDDARGHQNRGGEPGNEIIEPVRVGHVLSTAWGGLRVGDQRPAAGSVSCHGSTGAHIWSLQAWVPCPSLPGDSGLKSARARGRSPLRRPKDAQPRALFLCAELSRIPPSRMPKRTDIASILIIGAGPIVIGQACEFDYSGTQACKALKAEGYRIVLVNSNPATIMTDPDLADATYIEPITPEIVARIIEKERYAVPGGFALLPTMGGQTALNTALSLNKMGVLARFDVEMIGATAQAIDKAEDRELFREAMHRIGLETPRSQQVKTLIHALEALEDIGLPAIIRPSFTLGGTGGGIAYNKAEFIDIVERGIDASPTNEVLIEESVLGWKEFEMEVVRDKRDNCIIICSIENIDPMGVHTGDSITIAPALTLTDKEYQIMRDASIAVLREIGVETGGSNVQFAVNPADGRLVIIEMNPRVSRSSALASKATGFPIAKVAAKLAIG